MAPALPTVGVDACAAELAGLSAVSATAPDCAAGGALQDVWRLDLGNPPHVSWRAQHGARGTLVGFQITAAVRRHRRRLRLHARVPPPAWGTAQHEVQGLCTAGRNSQAWDPGSMLACRRGMVS